MVASRWLADARITGQRDDLGAIKNRQGERAALTIAVCAGVARLSGRCLS